MIRFALCLALLPLPAAAQTFGLPQGCTAYLTVQKRGCTVSHLFTCEGDPAGHQRRADLGEEGLQYVGVIDAETQWIESWHVEADSTERLLPGGPDPASFTELSTTGRDTFEFSTLSDGIYETIFRGQDELTGETVVIDGVTLDRTAFQVTAYDPAGNELWRTSGNEYISRAYRTFFSGTRTTVNSTETFDSDGTPIEFIFPGEDGFLASSPRHDCGALMSKATVAAPLLPERN
jgi:hypothetical protein